jgi:hypothetical protein
MGERTPTERYAASFVLSVADRTADWEAIARQNGFLGEAERFPRFDLFEAFVAWDYDHRDSLLLWLHEMHDYSES